MGSKLRTVWTREMDRYFIDIMLEQVKRRDSPSFCNLAWEQISASFNARFEFPYEIGVLKSRYSALWKLCNDARQLTDQDGSFGDDDENWRDYLQGHPRAQLFLRKKIPYFKDMCKIFPERKKYSSRGDSNVIDGSVLKKKREAGFLSQSQSKRRCDEEVMSPEAKGSETRMDLECEPLSGSMLKKEREAGFLSQSKSRCQHNDLDEEVTRPETEGSETRVKLECKPRPLILAMEALMRLPGLDDATRAWAAYIFLNEDSATTFASLDDRSRLVWLDKHVKKHTQS